MEESTSPKSKNKKEIEIEEEYLYESKQELDKNKYYSLGIGFFSKKIKH